MVRAYLASGGCHVSTGKHPPSPDGQQPLQTWWARDGVQKGSLHRSRHWGGNTRVRTLGQGPKSVMPILGAVPLNVVGSHSKLSGSQI